MFEARSYHQRCIIPAKYSPVLPKMECVAEDRKKISLRREDEDDHKKPNDGDGDGDGDGGLLEGKATAKRPNSFPVMVLILMGIVLQIHPTVSKDLKCSHNQIAWKNKTTNKIEACMDCPPCAPSQQYSIPCGVEVDIGTDGRCVDCPSGMYSDRLDTKRCVDCTVCTNKRVLQNCTKYQNAICGRCTKGYVYDPVIFGCVPSSTQSNRIPTASPTTLPTTQLTSQPTTSPPSSTQSSFSPILTGPTTLANQTKSTAVQGKKDSPHTSIPNTTGSTSNLGHSFPVWAVALISIASLLTIILVICKVYSHISKQNSRLHVYRCARNIEADGDESTSLTIEPRSGHAHLLKDFMYKNYEDFDKLCKVLLKNHLGAYDFEKVASKWKIKKEDCTYFKSLVGKDKSPVREICETLLTQKPHITVEMLANSLRDINKDAYKILEPNFIAPEEQAEAINESAC